MASLMVWLSLNITMKMIPKQHYLSEDLAFSQMDFSLVAQLSF
jgi:hypothetical protein